MALIFHKKVRESLDIFTRFQFSIVRTGFIYFFMMEQDMGIEPTSAACGVRYKTRTYIFSHSLSVYFFISDDLCGKFSLLHHLRILLSVTPNISPIFVNGVLRIKFFNSSRFGLTAFRYLKWSQATHLVAPFAISHWQSTHSQDFLVKS